MQPVSEAPAQRFQSGWERSSPELNPVENIWEFLRGNFLSHRVWESYDAIVDACCHAWNALMNMPDRLASITKRSWAKAVIE